MKSLRWLQTRLTKQRVNGGHHKILKRCRLPTVILPPCWGTVSYEMEGDYEEALEGFGNRMG